MGLVIACLHFLRLIVDQTQLSERSEQEIFFRKLENTIK